MAGPEPPKQDDLFPASWITGVAAAELARFDEDVLIDEVAAATRPAAPQAPGVGRRRRPSEAELNELRREMQRLEQQMEAMRRRPRYLDGRLPGMAVRLMAPRAEPTIPVVSLDEPADAPPGIAPRRRRIGRIPAVAIGAVGVVAAIAILAMALSLAFGGDQLGARVEKAWQGIGARLDRVGAGHGAKVATLDNGLGARHDRGVTVRTASGATPGRRGTEPQAAASAGESAQ